MLDAPLKRIAAAKLDGVASALHRVGVGPTALTIVGFATGLTAAAMIANEDYLLAVLFLVLNRLFDIFDGLVARRRGVTRVGAFLDVSFDLFVYAAIPFAFALAHQPDALAAIFLLMGLTLVAGTSLAARVAGGDKGPAPGFAFFEHTEIFLAFIILCIVERWTFSIFAYLFGLLCVASGVVRVVTTVAALRAMPKP
jgi:phosphatidylglycerophosphate synthase